MQHSKVITLDVFELWLFPQGKCDMEALHLQVLDRFLKIPSDTGCSVAHCVSDSRLEGS